MIRTLALNRSSKALRGLILLAMLAALILGALQFTRALAAAPGTGVVVEGASVPGVALGDTRAQVEAAYGQPRYCQSVEVAGDMASCSFDVEGGGQVSVRYRGPNGGNAGNSPDDVAYNLRWSQQVSGWTTTAGVNTTLAIQDPDAAIAAYPNAEVIYNPTFGNIESIEDRTLGILIDYHFEYLSGRLFVSMAISNPSGGTPPPPTPTPTPTATATPPPPSEDGTLRISAIDLALVKRDLQAAVSVKDEQNQAVSGAEVSATWLLPGGSSVPVTAQTDGSGEAQLEIKLTKKGTYTLQIDGVALDGYEFDPDASVLSASYTR